MSGENTGTIGKGGRGGKLNTIVIRCLLDIPLFRCFASL